MKTTYQQFRKNQTTRLLHNNIPRSSSCIQSRSRLLEMLLKSQMREYKNSITVSTCNEETIKHQNRRLIDSVTQISRPSLPKVVICSSQFNLCPQSQLPKKEKSELKSSRRVINFSRSIPKTSPAKIEVSQRRNLQKRRVDFQTFNYEQKLNLNNYLRKISPVRRRMNKQN